MKLKFGVVDTDLRSVTRPVTPVGVPVGMFPVVLPIGTTSVLALGGVVDDRVEVHERVVAGRVPVARHRPMWSGLSAPMSDGAQVTPPSRVGSLPMSSS